MEIRWVKNEFGRGNCVAYSNNHKIGQLEKLVDISSNRSRWYWIQIPETYLMKEDLLKIVEKQTELEESGE